MQVIIDRQRGAKRPLHLKSICQAVCEFFDVHESELRGVRRHKRITFARHVFCYIAFEYTDSSKNRIGGFLNRDHTTIIHALKKILRDHEGDLEFTEMCVHISKEAYEIDEARRQELKREAEELNKILGVKQSRDLDEFEATSEEPKSNRASNGGSSLPASPSPKQETQRLSGRVCDIRKTDKGYWVYPER